MGLDLLRIARILTSVRVNFVQLAVGYLATFTPGSRWVRLFLRPVLRLLEMTLASARGEVNNPARQSETLDPKPLRMWEVVSDISRAEVRRGDHPSAYRNYYNVNQLHDRKPAPFVTRGPSPLPPWGWQSFQRDQQFLEFLQHLP